MDSSRQLLWILPDNSYGFFQTTLMDSSRQLLWILPDNSYGFFQTTLMDSSRQLLWILPDNYYGFFQTTLMDSSRQLLWILPDNSYGFFQIPWIFMTHDLTGKDVFWKVIEWQEHWLKDQCRFLILLHWRMWSPGTTGHGVTCCSRNTFIIQYPWVRC